MAASPLPGEKSRLDEKKLEAVTRLFEQTVEAREKTKKRKAVFVSWCERNPLNSYLVEDLIDPFLITLGFDVHYYRKDKLLGIPNDVIHSIQESCEITIAFYTRDDDDRPAGNVIKETDRIAPNRKVVFYEEGVDVESMTRAEALCISFSREKYGELLLRLVEVLTKNQLLSV